MESITSINALPISSGKEFFARIRITLGFSEFDRVKSLVRDRLVLTDCVKTNSGRIDAVIENGGGEFKFSGTKEEALAQVKKNTNLFHGIIFFCQKIENNFDVFFYVTSQRRFHYLPIIMMKMIRIC